MKYLEKQIFKKGRVLDGDVLKIDSFLNHQIDPNVITKLGKEFYKLFKNDKVTKILTVESSGISVAYETSKYFGNIPVVFAKKVSANSQGEAVYGANLHSYTRQKDYTITVVKNYLNKDDYILIIDDFLAMGQALNALISIVDQANATLVGCGICVEKAFQPGGKCIREKGIRVESLAKIKSMSEDHIEFED